MMINIKKFLTMRNKYRDYILYFIILFPVIITFICIYLSILSMDNFGLIFIGGWGAGYNIYAFLYDKNYIAMVSLPVDDSTGRYVAAPIFFIIYIFCVLSPFLLGI